MSRFKKLPIFAIVGVLAIGMVAFSSVPSFARGPGGGGPNGGGHVNGPSHSNSPASQQQGQGANNAARNQLHRCLGNTCGISRTIDDAASKVYKRMQFWK